MSLSVFVFPPVPRAPDRAPVPHQQPIVREFHDGRILCYVQEQLGQPVHLMRMANALVELDRPRSRTQRRIIFKTILGRITALLREGAIHRYGRKHVVLVTQGEVPPVPPPKPRRPKMSKAVKKFRVRAPSLDHAPTAHLRIQRTELESPAEPRKTESVAPPSILVPASPVVPTDPVRQTPQHLVQLKRFFAIRTAARALPRTAKNRHWLTGWLDDRTRLRHQQPVLTPEGETMLVAVARRGRVLVMAPEETPLGVSPFRVLRADEIRIAKNPHAVLLGSLKRGVQEKPSQRKAEAARRNGCCPCRHGRKRGRPRKT